MPTPLTQTTGRRKEAVARVRLRPGTGKITVNRRELADKNARLAAVTAAVLDESAARAQMSCHIARMRMHDRGFGSRWIVFGQLADRVEERGAAFVVEVLRGQLLLRPRQAGNHVIEEAACIRAQIVE